MFQLQDGVVTEYIGYVAGALTVISYLPQVIRTIRTKQAADLSLGMFGLLLAAGALWITYGVMTTKWPVIATNIGTVTLNVVILGAKFRYRGNEPDHEEAAA
jgi:MtN3 and saliva related transmembrane protein